MKNTQNDGGNVRQICCRGPRGPCGLKSRSVPPPAVGASRPARASQIEIRRAVDLQFFVISQLPSEPYHHAKEYSFPNINPIPA